MREHHKEAHDGKSCICPKCNLPQKRFLLPAYHNPCKKEYKVERIKDEDGNYLDEPSPPKPRQRLTDRPTMKTREHLHSHYLKEGEDPMTFRTFTSHLVLTKDNGKEDFKKNFLTLLTCTFACFGYSDIFFTWALRKPERVNIMHLEHLNIYYYAVFHFQVNRFGTAAIAKLTTPAREH